MNTKHLTYSELQSVTEVVGQYDLTPKQAERAILEVDRDSKDMIPFNRVRAYHWAHHVAARIERTKGA